MRSSGVVFLTVFLCLPLLADIDIRTNTLDVYYRGGCEEAGAITLSVNGDDFPTADPTAPVFIRIRLHQDATLCGTLVDVPGARQCEDCTHALKPLSLVQGDETVDVPQEARANPYDPLYLAMRKEPISSSPAMNAPPECVSIVRWIAGEREIWLRIQNPSNTWLSLGGVPRPPSPSSRVAWTFGVTARGSFARNSSGYPSWANLSANTKSPSAMIGSPSYRQGFAISSLLCVNLTQSTLQPMPSPQAFLYHDISAFDASTTGVMTEPDPSNIQPGLPLPVVIDGDDTVGRGINVSCAINVIQPPVVTTPMCVSHGSQSATYVTNEFDIEVHYEPGVFPNSYFYMATPPNSSYGFRVITVGGEPLPIIYFSTGEEGYGVWVDIEDHHWVAFAFAEDLFQNGNDWFARLVFVLYWPAYYNPPLPGPISTHHVTASIGIPCGSPPQEVVVETGAWVANHDLEWDDYPFDGTLDDGDPYSGVTIWDQARDCPQDFLHAGPQTIVLGHFILPVPTLSKTMLLILVAVLAIGAVLISRRMARSRTSQVN